MIQTVDGCNVNTGKIKNYGVELEAQYRINSHWSICANRSILHMDNPVVGAPKYKDYLGVNYNDARWAVVAGIQYVGDLYTAVGKNEQKENFCLLNATVNYALCKTVGLWLRGENLLAQRYEINQGYPMPLATFMGGVNLNF